MLEDYRLMMFNSRDLGYPRNAVLQPKQVDEQRRPRMGMGRLDYTFDYPSIHHLLLEEAKSIEKQEDFRSQSR